VSPAAPAGASAMMVACTSYPFQNLPLDQALVRMDELGFRYADVSISCAPGSGHMTPAQVREEPVAALEIVESAMDRSRVRIVVFDLETKAFDLSERGEVEAVCRLARRAGVGVVSVMRAPTKNAALDMRRLRDFHRLAADFGVALSVEPYRQPSLTIAEAAGAVQAAGLRVTLDVGRLLGGGLAQEEWGPIYPLVSHVHLYDAGAEGGRVPWGTGIVKLRPIVAGLKAAGYRGFITAEYLGRSPGDRVPFDPEPELVKARKAVEEELARPKTGVVEGD